MAEVGDLFRDAGFIVPSVKAPPCITGTFGYQTATGFRLVIQDQPEDWLARFARQKENYDA
jgi:hypothetical protein